MTIRGVDETPGACKRRAESVLSRRTITRSEGDLARDVLSLVTLVLDLQRDLDATERRMERVQAELDEVCEQRELDPLR